MKAKPAAAALAMILLALPLAPSKQAHAQNFTPDLYTCAALYDVLDANKRSQQGIESILSGPGLDESLWWEAGAFWAFSNARHIDFGARRDALKKRSGASDLAFDIRVCGISVNSRFPSPTSEAAGFSQGPVTSSTRPPSASDTPPYGQWIRACDQIHGFMPIFSFGATDHLSCVVRYYTLGAMHPGLRKQVTPRVQQATRAHIRATPGTTVDDVRRELPRLARARGQQIQNTADGSRGLINDVHACDAQYGLAQLSAGG